MNPAEVATSQYATTSGKLVNRMELLDFDTHREHWYTWVRLRIPLEGDIIEVGAGTGQLWRSLQNTSIRLTLTDSSPVMCEHLRQIRVATVKECDVAELPFPDASFNVAIANHMLYHVDDPDNAFQQLARVLKPGGTLIATLNGRDHIQEIHHIGEAIGRTSAIVKRARISAETMPSHLGNHMVLVSAERAPGCFKVTGWEPVLHYLNSWGEGTIDQDMIEKVKSLVESRTASDGAFTVTKNMVLFTARRT
ncbi:methyltransferase type 11 [Biscogniauxia marginata]|nr:methyltransferase type 11 [Biscogniauxia marginata]